MTIWDIVVRTNFGTRTLVRQPDRGPDFAEFARDLAPGRAGILGNVDFAEEAERHNAVAVGGMRGKAPDGGIGLGGEGHISQLSPKLVVRSTCPFSPVV